jgi:hypothetical protein
MAKTKTTELPSHLMFFDTETQDIYKGKNPTVQRHVFWFGYAITVDTKPKGRPTITNHYLSSTDSFWELLSRKLSKDRPLYLFAHNLTFDLTIVDFWNRHRSEGFEVTYAVLENPPMFLSLQKDGKKLCIVDTFNFWKTNVSAMGEALGLEKLTMPTSKVIDSNWKKYCLRDVEILMNQILQLFTFLKDNELSSFRISAPGLAYGTFKRRFMNHDIYIHDRSKVLALERACYSGGMVRNFFVGTVARQKIYKYDVNSLYPSMMLKLYPTKLLEDMSNCSPSKLLNKLRGKMACAAVKINCYDRTYPKQHNKRLCEVLGKYSTFLCGQELQTALALGHVTKVAYAALYDVAPIFKDYINFFWTLRKNYKLNGNRVGEQFVKLLMNSLYGRFGMKGHTWVDFTNKNLEDYYVYYGVQCPKRYLSQSFSPIVDSFRHSWDAEGLEDPIILRYFSGNLQMQFPTGEHSESFCGIAAFVTSYARERLRELIAIAGEKEVYYCDTDSLFVTDLGSKRLIKANEVDDTALGKLKLEGISSHTVFYGPKDYIFDDEPVRKGIRKNAKQINDNTFEQDLFEGLKSIMNRGGDAYVDITKIQKTLNRKITKGVLKDQGKVTPLILNEVFG